MVVDHDKADRIVRNAHHAMLPHELFQRRHKRVDEVFDTRVDLRLGIRPGRVISYIPSRCSILIPMVSAAWGK